MDSGVDTSNESDNNQVDQSEANRFLMVTPFNVDPNVAAAFSEPGGNDDSPGKMKSCTHSKKCRLRLLQGIYAANTKRLLTAAYTNNAEAVEKLLKEGVNPNTTDEQKRSPLHLAACRGYTSVVKTLLKHGADPNVTDTIGNTPLHLAACTSHFPVVVNLLNAGTDVTLNDRHGRTPIQLAESKLRILKLRGNGGSVEERMGMLQEVHMVIDMMIKYWKEQMMGNEKLDSLCQRLESLKTKDDVNVQEVLDSLNSLNLK